MVPKKDGSAIVGNVLGTNDGVVAPSATSKKKVDVSGSKLPAMTKGNVSVGADLSTTGTGFAVVAKKVSEKVLALTDEPESTEVNEVPVV